MINIVGAWFPGSLGGFTAPGAMIEPIWDDSHFSLHFEGPVSPESGVPLLYELVDPLPVEPDGGIGDGAGPIGEPIPVDSDGGIGDGAGPLDGPIPVEPDGGIGDGAEPLDGGDDTVSSEGTGELDNPIPVEPDGGIGDGAGPIPIDGPIPVEPDGGIGDGAGPIDGEDGLISIPENNIDGGGEGTTGNDFFYATEESDVFIFKADHGNDTVTGFDVTDDVLDLSGTHIDFTDIESLMAHATESAAEDGTVYGVLIETGNGNDIYLDGVSIADFASMTIEF
ncbi:MAG: hypothetical protein HWE25_06170 [Alphaproteobacteria bacterium]|nr:hypothetical protein [Alphaproteobacteria bacterium]